MVHMASNTVNCKPGYILERARDPETHILQFKTVLWRENNNNNNKKVKKSQLMTMVEQISGTQSNQEQSPYAIK